jgi:DNA-binding transcriptional regulator YiaG
MFLVCTRAQTVFAIARSTLAPTLQKWEADEKKLSGFPLNFLTFITQCMDEQLTVGRDSS